MHLVHTRPDIENALNQCMSNTYGLRYTSNNGVLLFGHAYSDWDGSAVDRKNTSGYCFSMGSTMISWSSRKQGSIAQSTTKAEYIAASDACKEAVWIRKLVYDLFVEKFDSTIIHCDN